MASLVSGNKSRMQAAMKTPPEKQEEKLKIFLHLALRSSTGPATNLKGIKAKTAVAIAMPINKMAFSALAFILEGVRAEWGLNTFAFAHRDTIFISSS